MIGKISKGEGFKGCVNYVLGKPEARLLVAEGVLTDSIQTITDCFQAQRMMKPNIRQPVGHISLSYAPEDTPRMTDEMLVSLAKEYMQKMGIKDTQYIIARHNDQKHPHVHIVFNRVNNNGRTISDKNDCYRNVKVCKELKEKYGPSNPQPIGFSGILLAKRQNSFYCTYFLHNRNVADTKSPYPIKRLEVIRWFNQKSMVFNQSLS